jgi:hypothetical protein
LRQLPGAEGDPADWARYIGSVGLGIAVKATFGAPRDELYRAVNFAMRGWPAV